MATLRHFCQEAEYLYGAKLLLVQVNNDTNKQYDTDAGSKRRVKLPARNPPTLYNPPCRCHPHTVLPLLHLHLLSLLLAPR